MKQRLQKILSDRGVTSRRKGEALIGQGKVTVNGQIAALGMTAHPQQTAGVFALSDPVQILGRPPLGRHHPVA